MKPSAPDSGRLSSHAPRTGRLVQPNFLPGIAHHTLSLVPSKGTYTHKVSLITYLSCPIRDLPCRTTPLLHVHQLLAFPSLSPVPERV